MKWVNHLNQVYTKGEQDIHYTSFKQGSAEWRRILFLQREMKRLVDLSKKPHADDKEQNARQTKTIITGGLAHLLHDGFTDMLYVFFPIRQGVLGLSFAEIGFLKTLFSGTMAFFQVPSGLLANRLGEVKLLLIGTFLTSSAIIFLGWGTHPLLLGCLLIMGGLGSSVQHPLAPLSSPAPIKRTESVV